MTDRNDRRETFIDRMANHVLSQGLAGATLRPLAAAAGTSDRMLLYYFTDKDELLTAVLERVAARLLSELDAAVAVGPRPFDVLLTEVWAILGAERLQAYMRVWLDLASGAARHLQPHRAVAGTIADGYVAWAAARLDGPNPEAARFITTVQGMYLLAAIGRPTLAETAVSGVSAISA